MSIKRLAGFVRRVTTDVARVAATLEILALPSAFLEIHAGQIVARCSCCRQVTRLVVPGELGQIAAVLAARPDPETRTWQTSESVADLERENREHGISVPGDEPDEPPETIREVDTIIGPILPRDSDPLPFGTIEPRQEGGAG